MRSCVPIRAGLHRGIVRVRGGAVPFGRDLRGHERVELRAELQRVPGRRDVCRRRMHVPRGEQPVRVRLRENVGRPGQLRRLRARVHRRSGLRRRELRSGPVHGRAGLVRRHLSHARQQSLWTCVRRLRHGITLGSAVQRRHVRLFTRPAGVRFWMRRAGQRALWFSVRQLHRGVAFGSAVQWRHVRLSTRPADVRFWMRRAGQRALWFSVRQLHRRVAFGSAVQWRYVRLSTRPAGVRFWMHRGGRRALRRRVRQLHHGVALGAAVQWRDVRLRAGPGDVRIGMHRPGQHTLRPKLRGLQQDLDRSRLYGRNMLVPQRPGVLWQRVPQRRRQPLQHPLRGLRGTAAALQYEWLRPLLRAVTTDRGAVTVRFGYTAAVPCSHSTTTGREPGAMGYRTVSACRSAQRRRGRPSGRYPSRSP